jgi:hypothetical protein
LAAAQEEAEAKADRAMKGRAAAGEATGSAEAKSSETLDRLSHADAAQALLGRLNATGVWHDHATQEVFEKGTLTTMLPWAFKPRYWHWLQAAWVKS